MVLDGIVVLAGDWSAIKKQPKVVRPLAAGSSRPPDNERHGYASHSMPDDAWARQAGRLWSCRWLGGQPQCRSRLPMSEVPGVGEVSSEILLAMRKTRLVRHRSDCAWTLSPRWKTILLEL
jgi:hypothetical protein